MYARNINLSIIGNTGPNTKTPKASDIATDTLEDFRIKPDPENTDLFREVEGYNQNGEKVISPIIHEVPLSILLNDQRVITAVTIGDYAEELAVGYLLNQNMIDWSDESITTAYEKTNGVVRVHAESGIDIAEVITKKTQTSGCGIGTVYGDLLEKFEKYIENPLAKDEKYHTSWLYSLTKKINTCPSLYLKTGAIHGCILCEQDRPLIYTEDVGRHNAIDKIAGFMKLMGISPAGKSLYTTGRLTSEIVLKCIQMNIPTLVSRSGFTAWGVDLAQELDLTLIGRARGQRFTVLSGHHRLVYDANPHSADDEPKHLRRKGSFSDE